MVSSDRLSFNAPNLASVEGVRHGFFTREGGVSTGIYASLNCGVGSADAPANVSENRARIAEHLGVSAITTVFQKHSNIAAVTDAPWEDGNRPQADAIVTATPGLAIGILTADCAPVLLCDPEHSVIGAIHAGWRGALAGIVEAAVDAMTGLGADRARIRAAIGPAISQGAYEVGEAYKTEFLETEPSSEVFFAADAGSGEPHFDLPGYVAERLARAGVGETLDMGICTYNDETRLFSYRRSRHHGEDDYGRQISAIVLA